MVDSPWMIAGVSLAVAAGAVVSRGLFSPRGQTFGPVTFRGPAQGGLRIALTFDDGPHPTATDAIRRTLEKQGVVATFFVVGANVVRHPDAIRRLHEAGHEIGNHSFDHSYAGMFRGRRYWEDQLHRTNEAVENVTGQRPVSFRPPMGFKHPGILAAARNCRLKVVTWSRRGFDGIRTTSQRIHDRLAPLAITGDILMLHDGAPPKVARDPQATVDAVEPLIHTLKTRGFEMVRLDALLTPAIP